MGRGVIVIVIVTREMRTRKGRVNLDCRIRALWDRKLSSRPLSTNTATQRDRCWYEARTSSILEKKGFK